MAKKVKVLIVDDSSTYRRILSRIVSTIETAELVGTASSGQEALERLASLNPDFVALDIMMPDLDGFETLKAIKERAPDTQVVMISGADSENVDLTFKSLQNGALDFIPKPTALNMKEGLAEITSLLKPLIGVVCDRLNHRIGKVVDLPPSIPAKKVVGPPKHDTVDIALIGVSTGGPDALFKLFPQIEGTLHCPILLVQHMPPLFTQSLAENLNQITSLSVTEAKDGMIARKNQVVIAPGGIHMTAYLSDSREITIKLVDSPPVNHCKPSIDVLFNSVAMINDIRSLCVIMTGMGRDGTDGVRNLKQRDAYCLIQDQDTSVVWGMPGSIHAAGLQDEIIAVDKLGFRIQELIGSSVR